MCFKLVSRGGRGGRVGSRVDTRSIFRSIKPMLFALWKSKWPKGLLPESPFNTNQIGPKLLPNSVPEPLESADLQSVCLNTTLEEAYLLKWFLH